jgi:membrane-anchored protein YejM (alkaline phosphatase superfamily)
MKAKNRNKRTLIWGATGFAIPIVVLGLVLGLPLVFGDDHPMDRENDIARLPVVMLIPSIGCAFVFVLAARATSVDVPRISLIQSISIIGLAVVVTLLLVTTGPRYKMFDPDSWIKVAAPIGVGLVMCGVIFAINRRTRDTT